MKILWLIPFIIITLLLAACDNDTHEFDASGAFEADETIISSKATGTLLSFEVEEGQALTSNTYLGYVDTTELFLNIAQLEAQMEAVLSKKPDIAAQLAALNEQLNAAEIEKKRIDNLLQADAATPKQADDIAAQIKITKGNINALRSQLVSNTRSIDKEIGPLEAQIAILEDRISKSKIVNPVEGTVLTVYAEPHELVKTGQPLYKIANLDELTLRAYITGEQLPKIKLNENVTVLTDDGNGGYSEIQGEIYWISDKAEFTPKSIQTKNERANKVYAVKVRVKNNGTYKIGMYGEIKFNS